MKNIYLNAFKNITAGVEVGYELKQIARKCEEYGFAISIRLSEKAISLYDLYDFSYDDEFPNDALEKIVNDVLNKIGDENQLRELNNAIKCNINAKKLEILKEIKLDLLKVIDRDLFDIDSLVVYGLDA